MGHKSRTKRRRRRGDTEQVRADTTATTERIAAAEKPAAAEQAESNENAKKSTGSATRDWNAERDPDVLAEAALAKAQHLMAAAVRDSGLSYTDVALRTGRSPSKTAKLYGSDADLTVRTLAREVAVCGRRLKIETEKLPETGA